jgi:hypothetical protein
MIEAITSPLGFFVLALLIVESFLATVLLGGKVKPEDQMTCVWLGVGMFVLVVLGVWILVCLAPSNLIFDKHSHLLDRGRIPYGSDRNLVGPDKIFTGEYKRETTT